MSISTPSPAPADPERAAQATIDDLAFEVANSTPPVETHDGLASVQRLARELLETAVFVLLVFLLVRSAIQNFKIEGQSMEPSFHTSQYIFVNKLVYFHFDLNAPLRLLPGNVDLSRQVVYPFHMPQRGDVVVFEYPNDLSKDYIKRVIGLPGDAVRIEDGKVYVNDLLLEEPYLNGGYTTCRFDDMCSKGTVTVAPGTLFVMGDNRNNSSDSREWEGLPLDRVIGQAWVSYWPSDYWGFISTPNYPGIDP